MNQKGWKNRIRSGINVPRGTTRVTMGSSNEECVDARKNSWITTLSQCWSIPFPMLSPMGGSTFKMMSIPYIGWKARAVYLPIFLTIKYRIGWLCTWKVTHGIQVTGLVIWKNLGMISIWRRFSLFFAPINCIVVVTSQRRWKSTSPSDSTTWGIRTRSMDRMSLTPLIASLER